MALTASIYKIDVNLSNLNIHYYDDFKLVMAKHPSENESRMMFRLLAFLYSAHKDLEFTKGISATDEPELWQKDYSGEIIHWIDLGLPTEKRVRQATSQSKRVTIFTYHRKKTDDWLIKMRDKLTQNKKINVLHLEVVENGPLDKLVISSMDLSCTIEDNIMYIGNDNERIGIEVINLLGV